MMEESLCAVPKGKVLPIKKRRKRSKKSLTYCALSIIILSKENCLMKVKPPKLKDEYLYQSLFGHIFLPRGE